MLEKLDSLRLPLPEDVAKAKAAGDFDRAKRLIDLYRQDAATPKCMKDRLEVEQEVLLRLPQAYPYDEEQALAIVRKEIPSFTMEDLHHYEDSKAADWIYLNGKVHLQSRFFASMQKVWPEIAAAVGCPLSQTNQLLDDNIKEMEETGHAGRHIHLRTEIRIKDEVFHPGRVLVHLPIPAECMNMQNIHILDHSDHAFIDGPDSLSRTISFQEDLQENHPFFVEYEYDSIVRYHQDHHIPTETADFDIQEEQPQIVFSPLIKALCKELSKNETDPYRKAWNFYRYCTENVTYAYMREYMTLGLINEYSATQRIGDCGVKALLFITLCRCAGIPAHWQSGLYVTPESAGNHDWAMFYIKPYGWLFADPSFGGSAFRVKNLKRQKFYFGNLDSFRMAANNAFQQEFKPAKKWWRSDPYDNQSGEIEYDDRGLHGNEFESTKTVIEMQKLK
ncbi:MAG: transglutaminase-like domain-containing protein [Lactimicrobium sp.]|jgi:hypothetical protein|uniref:transglutaminase-like domain-containing protein n=1 Tax=Lactimicrobium sp. TaxID=2563780 RepID=UPI002F3600A3